MIRLTKVSKEYPRTGLALNDVTLHIAKGEFAFLTGPSGSGKSTMLRLIYMEERPTTGEIRV
ncbi:MAG TPA: ATP-binding cassette domain-containing protein, partial [Gemmatimonadaceae bacterium]|nr:ATP-binding cassette domain-containing protein [Gemmatimonadaceae bacterium]